MKHKITMLQFFMFPDLTMSQKEIIQYISTAEREEPLIHMPSLIKAKLLLLLLLSHFSSVWLCATPQTAAHQAPPSLGFSRQEHWSGLLFPSPMHESEKWKWSSSVVSNSYRPHGKQLTKLLHPWDFLGKSTGVGCHCLLQKGKIETFSNEGKLRKWSPEDLS